MSLRNKGYNITRGARKAHKAHVRRRGIFTMKDTTMDCVSANVRTNNKLARTQKQENFNARVASKSRG